MTDGIQRRRFLKAAGVGTAAAFLARIQAVAADVVEAADALGDHASDADAYTVDAGVSYLNHAAIGTMPKAVQDARNRYLRLCEDNPWHFLWSGAWEPALATVRESAAALLNTRPDAIAFTHNTTEGFNLLAQGLPLAADEEVLFSDLNHAGASVCFEHHGARRGFQVRRFSLPPESVAALSKDAIVAAHLEAIGPRTRVLVLPHIDNLIGLRHPVKEIAAGARERGVRWVLADGAQSIGMLPVDLTELGVDAYAGSPHKWLQAPKGLGLLALGPALRAEVEPMWVTWGQARWTGSARRFEDYGTRNLPEVLTLGDAIAFHQARAGQKLQHYRRLFETTRSRVLEDPVLTWQSPADWSIGASLYAIGLGPGRKAGEVARFLFEQHGIVVRPWDQPGLNALRVSPNTLNPFEDIDRLLVLMS